MLRVLAPSGRWAVAVWDSLENAPAYAAEVALVERIAGRRAADALRAPFVLGVRKDLAALFASVGMPSVTITSPHGMARFPSIRSVVEADLRGWLPVMGVALSQGQIHRILEEAEAALGPHVAAEGEASFDVPAHIVTGTKE